MTTMQRILPTLLLAAVTVSSAVTALAKDKIDKGLKKKSKSEPVEVIVRFKKGASIRVESAKQRTNNKIKSKGGEVGDSLPSLPLASVSVLAGDLDDLASDPEIESIVPNREVEVLGSERGDKVQLDYAIDTIGASYLHQVGYTGRQITVAVIDSGIVEDSEDLFCGSKDKKECRDGERSTRVLYSENFLSDERGKVKKDEVKDEFGHGTHVAGIIGANGSSDMERPCQ